MANVTIKINSEGGDKVLKNVNDIKNAISELEKQSADLDLGSEAFEQSKNQIDELKKKLQELSKSQAQLDQEMSEAAERNAEQRAQRMEKIGGDIAKFAAGVTDAFAGALIAFGAGEEDAKAFNETLQKGLGIAIGVKGGIEALVAGVELAGPAFEAFNAVLAANPIGVVVAALAALAAGIYLVVKAINAEEKESEKLTKQLEKQAAAAERLKVANESEVVALENKVNLLKNQGKSIEEVKKAEDELYIAKRKGLEQDLIQVELSAEIAKTKLAEAIANETVTESIYDGLAAYNKSIGKTLEAEAFAKQAENSRKERQKTATDDLQKQLIQAQNIRNAIAKLDGDKAASDAAFTATILEDRKKLELSLAEGRQKELNDQKTKYEEQVKLAHGNAKLLEEAAGNNRLAIYDINHKYDLLEAQQKKDAIKAEVDAEQAASDYLASLNKSEVVDTQATEAAKLSASLTRYRNEKEAADKAKKDRQEERQEETKLILEAIADLSNAFSKIQSPLGNLASSITTSFSNAFKVIRDEAATTVEKVGASLDSIASILQAVDQYQNQRALERTANLEKELDANLNSLSTAKDAELAKVGLTEQQKANINNAYAQKEYQLRLASYNKETEVKKKAFEQDKKLKIATTIINTATGALAALTGMIAAIPGPGGIIAGALAAAAVAATGAVQIAAIKNTKFEAGSPPAAPTLSAPTDNSGGGVEQSGGGRLGPQLNQITGDENNGSGGNNRNNGGKPIKAYVISQEVTTSQNMDAVIERRSSF